MTLTIYHPHAWDLPPDEAIRLQQELRTLVKIQPLPCQTIRRVGGIDASIAGDKISAAVVVLDYATQQPVEQEIITTPVTFPYIPGLLSFREAPGFLAVLARLCELPDVLIIDGHGLAHPRRFGIAAHLGVLLDVPTIGCAKSRLIGQHGPLGEEPGSTAELVVNDEVVGLAVRTRHLVKPVYISIGHRVDLSSALQIVLACGRGYRLPEPTRLAHQLAAQKKGSIV